MKFIKAIFACLVFCYLFPMANPSVAQNKIQNRVFGNGSRGTTNSAFRIAHTLGQPIIGVASNQSTRAWNGFWVQTIGLITSVEQISDDATIPKQFRLEQNYPNPFNPSTTIQFAIPVSSPVSIKLYDVLGRQVVVLLDEEMQPGVYKLSFEAGELASGVYFYRIQASEFTQTRKLMLLK